MRPRSRGIATAIARARAGVPRRAPGLVPTADDDGQGGDGPGLVHRRRGADRRHRAVILDGARAAGKIAHGGTTRRPTRSRRCACSRSSSAGCCGHWPGCGPTPSPPSTAAYGTEKHDDYFFGLRREGARRPARRPFELSTCATSSTHGRARTAVAAAEEAAPRPETRSPRPRADAGRQERLMEALLLAVYAFFVWLISSSRFRMAAVEHHVAGHRRHHPGRRADGADPDAQRRRPSSSDVRVIKYVVQVIPQVRGRVVEVPVEPNRLVKKGELLFRIDPTPHERCRRQRPSWPTRPSCRQAGAALVDASPARASCRGAAQVRQAGRSPR